jgi:hypothetical protein
MGGIMKRDILLSYILLIGLMWGIGAVATAQNAERKEKTKKEGRLGEFEDEAEDDDSTEIQKDKKQKRHHHHHSWLAIDDMFFMARMTYGLLVKFPGEERHFYNGSPKNSRYSEFPYAQPKVGLFSQSGGRRQAFVLSGNYFYDDADLDGTVFRAYFSPDPFVSLEVHFADLREDLHSYRDRLQIYSGFINYNRFRLNRFAFRWGLGWMGLRGDDVHSGIAFNSAMEWYFAHPLSLELNYSGGFIGNEFIPEFYTALNMHYRRVAFAIGYQYWSSGNVTLDGFSTGLKLYL